MGEVLGDLARLGFDADWESIPAAAVGAPHLRDRLFIVAYPDADRCGLNAQRKVPTVLLPRESEPWHQPGELRPDVPNPNGEPLSERALTLATAQGERESEGPQRQRVWLDPHDGSARDGDVGWTPEPDVGRLVDGLPSRLARKRLAALGNAVVPQVAEWIGRRILEAEARVSA